MSIPSETELRELKAETIVTATTPSTDSMRRLEVFNRIKDGAQSFLASLDQEWRRRFPEGFLHFAIIHGPKGFPSYEGHHLGFPYGSPFVAAPSPNSYKQVQFLLQRIAIGSSTDIQLMTSWLPGSLRGPVCFGRA